jgi:hypothetical protein
VRGPLAAAANSTRRDLRLDPLCITCDPDNAASRRTCELARAVFVEIVDVPETCIIHRTGHKKKCRYWLELGRGLMKFLRSAPDVAPEPQDVAR